MVSLTTFNSVATYSCDSGFTLNGATMRICQQNETWSADAPTCESELTHNYAHPGVDICSMHIHRG